MEIERKTRYIDMKILFAPLHLADAQQVAIEKHVASDRLELSQAPFRVQPTHSPPQPDHTFAAPDLADPMLIQVEVMAVLA